MVVGEPGFAGDGTATDTFSVRRVSCVFFLRRPICQAGDRVKRVERVFKVLIITSFGRFN